MAFINASFLLFFKECEFRFNYGTPSRQLKILRNRCQIQNPIYFNPLIFLFLIVPPAIESIKISDISMKLPDFAPLPAPEI